MEDMITCQEALARVYEYLDGELSPEWTEKVRRHVEVCRRCWPRFEVERAFLDRIRERGLPAARAQGLKERIVRLLDEVEDSD
jgi:anti-sigma factor (TIGR02949 family)